MLVGEVFARMGLDSKQYEKDLSRLEGVTRRKATTLGDIFKNAFSVAFGIGVFEAVKRGFQTIAGTAISFNAQMEQARIAFTSMLGSAEAADVFLRKLYDFAARTPFEFPELLDASKRMLAYGFAAGDVLPMMEAVGNATAALGLGAQGIDRIILALGQMRAKGKLSGEEMRQLTEAGIPAWEMLAEAMGKTTAEIMDMQSKGLIPADRAIKMLVEGMNKRFPNMMAQMENTWEGVTSTIKDVWRMTIGALTSSLFEGLKTWLQGVRDWAVDFYDTFQKYGLQRAISESFGPEVAAMVSVLGATLRGLASVVRAVTGFIKQYGKQIKFVVIVLGTYLALTKAVTLAKQIMIAVTAVERGQLLAKIPVLNVVSTAMGIYRVQMALAAQQGIVLTGVIAKLRVALYSLWSALGPIGWIILGLSAAVGVGTHLWGKYTQSVYSGAKVHDELAEGIDQVEGSAGDAAGAIEDEADALKKAGKAAGKNLQSFDEIHQLQEDMAGSAEDLAKSMGLDDTGLGVPEAGGLEIPDIGAQLEEMKPTLAGFWEWIKQGAGNLWQGVKEKWNGFWDWVKSWGIWQWIADRWDGLKERAGNAWDGVKEKWGNFKEWAGNLWDGIKTNVQKSWESLKTNVPIVWEGIKTNIETSWNTLSTGAKKTWASIKDTIQSNWDILKKEAPAAWDNIKTAISTKANEARDALKRAWDEITKKTNETWTSIKTNSGTDWNNIKTFLSQTWSSIQSNAGNTLTNMRNTISNAWNNIRSTTQTVWNNIKNAITSPIESAKQTVLNIIDRIKSAFANMKITIPKPKLPHITVTTKTKRIGDISIPIPDFDINWYAQGGIFDTPSVIGVGEAGAEAVLPLERNTGWMDTLAAKIAASIGGAGGGDIYVYVGNEQVDAYVYRSQDRRNVKSNGR